MTTPNTNPDNGHGAEGAMPVEQLKPSTPPSAEREERAQEVRIPDSAKEISEERVAAASPKPAHDGDDNGATDLTLFKEQVKPFAAQESKNAAHVKDVGEEKRKPITELFFYDHTQKFYWTLNSRGGWITVDEGSVRRMLKAAGYSVKSDGETPSEIDKLFVRIQRENDIAYAGALAGYRVGIWDVCGQRILVTSSPIFIQPKKGELPILRRLSEGLLEDERGNREQIEIFYSWLKLATEALRAGVIRPGQCMVIAGPKDCGKSLVKSLITLTLGGRESFPYQFFMGMTQFNSHLFGAEHLVVDD